MEVVCIKKILAQNLLIYIGLHCVRRSSWTVTTLANLVFICQALNNWAKKFWGLHLNSFPHYDFMRNFGKSYMYYWKIKVSKISCCPHTRPWETVHFWVIDYKRVTEESTLIMPKKSYQDLVGATHTYLRQAPTKIRRSQENLCNKSNATSDCAPSYVVP